MIIFGCNCVMEQSHASYIKGKIESQQSKLLILVISTDGLWLVSAKMDGKCIKDPGYHTAYIR